MIALQHVSTCPANLCFEQLTLTNIHLDQIVEFGMGDCFVKEEDGYAQGFNSQLKLKSNPISAFRVVGLIVLV